ncbi:hypothetical protein J4E86_000730 [Alternaria arbusti]|uniref:uncharacterized protein n=1 Tax=Alternaria arbusti TaxID=232088 RepID=UPI00221E8489|nr:uncharacterized protein J4E86_000730 [Alternaria arbusti]KAI4961701.1 hypothetical protein J4E86_000730 [Alternaria arbusti]
MMYQGPWDPSLGPPPGFAPHAYLPGEQLPAADDLTEAVETGRRCDYRDIYRVPTDEDPNRYHWVDEKPPVYGATGDKLRTKKAREAFAVNVYHRFDEVLDEWKIHELRINSTLLHAALEKILEGYPGLTQHEMKSFAPPFLPFIHRWEAMLSFKDNVEPESETEQHLELLQDVLEPLLKESFDKIRDVKTTGHVAFQDLNLVLIPAMMVLDHKTDSVGIVRYCNLTCMPPPTPKMFWSIGVDVVDWDGRRCGLLAQPKHVFQYQGLRALTALDVSPLEDLPDQKIIRERLIKRGRRFEALRGHFFKAFTDQHEERVNERMVIDARAYHKYQPAIPFPEYAKLSEIGQLTWAQSMERYSASVPNTPGSPIELDLSPMTNDECLLAVHYVKCFDIEKKKWERLDVTKIHEIPWAEHAFDSLVLDQDEKDLVLALVDRDQFKQGKPFDDFVVGKGQGMIMLLCGPPGVGKTLTAETVSEHLRRPLYKLGAGDLGMTARAVEDSLENALNLCGHFGAVLLLDEADVFMEARTVNNLQRNELVSVFLRLLEYYKGIMILTTNRMRSIDTAFESRIDITLSYSSLGESDRLQVWRNFLATIDAQDVDVGEAELEKLAKLNFNGRQIKSAIKTAKILAARKKERLSAEHLMVVLNLRQKALGMMDSGADDDEAGRRADQDETRSMWSTATDTDTSLPI